MIYFLAILLLYLFSVTLELSKRYEIKTIVYISSLFILISLAGLRGNIDPDYINYYDIFQSAKVDVNQGIEYGFFILNKIIIFFGLDFQWIIFLMALMSIGLKIKFFKDHSDNFALSLLIYFCSMYFLYDFIAIRQALAMGLFMVSIPYLIERKLVPYLCLIGIASSVHISALTLIPIYFIANYKYYKSILYFVVIIGVFVSVLQYNVQLVSYILKFLSLPGFAIDKIVFYSQEDVFASLSFRQLILGFLFIYFIPNDNKKFNVYLNIYVLGILLAILLNEIPQLSYRMKSYYFWSESILLVHVIFLTLRKHFYIKMLVYIILALVYSYALYGYLNVLAQRHDSYIFPYRFFFE